MASAAARASSWLRPPLPSPRIVTVVSPPATRQAGGESGQPWRAIPLPIPAKTFATSRASPSMNVESNRLSKPSSRALATAARAAISLLPTTTVCTCAKTESSVLGVSGISPASPARRRAPTEGGALLNRLYFARTCQASAKVLVSGTVGPEAMTSSGLPTTSDSMRETTVAGWASRANWPPLRAERCLRTALISPMAAPQRSSAPVMACLSARETSSAGRGISAEPPPEMTTRAKSRGVRPDRVSTMRAAPAFPASSGVG